MPTIYDLIKKVKENLENEISNYAELKHTVSSKVNPQTSKGRLLRWH